MAVEQSGRLPSSDDRGNALALITPYGTYGTRPDVRPLAHNP